MRKGHPRSNPEKTLRDPALVTDGLSRLVDSSAWHRNHEHYSDGYRIQIVIPGTPNEQGRYISVYRRSSREGTVTLAIPHIGESHSGLVNHVGEYESPRFLEWVARTVDPLFR